MPIDLLSSLTDLLISGSKYGLAFAAAMYVTEWLRPKER